MLKKVFDYVRKPEVYSNGTFNFWNDEHISKFLLDAHLDPNIEAASRKHDFIQQSVEWISHLIAPKNNAAILDLGCGPGLYAHELAKKGHQVTGIDFSKRSIEYALNQANKEGISINYLYQDYFDLDYENEFDVIMMIYCDYAVLSDNKRKILLEKCFRALKKDGIFLFDVFTPQAFKDKQTSTTWEYVADGGFWSENAYVCLESYWEYENDVKLEQYVLLFENNNIEVVRNWFKAFDIDSISDEIKRANFSLVDVYANVIGDKNFEESNTLCLLIKK